MLQTSADVRPEITSIFANVLDYRGPLMLDTSRAEVTKWDSLRHLSLVSAIEDNFSIALSMDEMVEIRSVRDICNILDRHGV